MSLPFLVGEWYYATSKYTAKYGIWEMVGHVDRTNINLGIAVT